jgi:hypothetical protein
MKIYSPNNIEVLLHYHTTPRPHPRIDAPATCDFTRILLEAGCITPGDTGAYITTAKGAAWVQALCNVECPREAYVDQNGNIL